MDHHHVWPSVALWVSLLCSMAGAFVAIFAGLWSAKHPRPRGFDFAASARRIRTMPIPPRGGA
ncbi:MAG TPA: hypothetical protein VKQ70_01165 [Caulobacteraceae bacterium]|jgi:hypothetical protein|nr:hypothetical protein [Caulobacteraceae bacterium]